MKPRIELEASRIRFCITAILLTKVYNFYTPWTPTSACTCWPRTGIQQTHLSLSLSYDRTRNDHRWLKAYK